MLAKHSHLPSAAKRGFTAVELIAVATILAILSMILVQQLRVRVEEAREAAVKHELSELADVISLASAETTRFYPLQDYDNTASHPDPPVDLTTEVPGRYYTNWNVTFYGTDSAERNAIINLWNGPYTSFRNYATIEELQRLFPSLIYRNAIGQGAIFRIDTNNEDFDDDDKYPLDPWGNPYVYFPPIVHETQQVTYRSGVIYSMGPDGLPGPDPEDLPLPASYPTASNYNPYVKDGLITDGKLGAPGSDDYTVEF